MEEYGIVYIWRDKGKDRYYIGAHWVAKEKDTYLCSSMWMRNSYKRRPEDFRRHILSRIYTTKFDMFKKELEWLYLIPEDELGNRYYNLQRDFDRKEGHWCANLNKAERTKNRISETRKKDGKFKGIRQSPHSEFKKGQVSPNKGKPLTEEHKLKLRTPMPEDFQIRVQELKSGNKLRKHYKISYDLVQRWLKEMKNE